ncbi:phosphate ABC transporter substrate-binding protein [Candidatus Acetothermia bacterium]|nr:phosphate ABC transporter substrate-binding protein [Candidatus Acetothermia bacterium]
MKRVFALVLIVTMLLSIAGTGIATTEVLRGTLVIGGSTTVYVVTVLLAERFMEKYPDIRVETHSVGSTAGIVGANEGTFDIGMSSRWLRGDEPGWGLTEFVVYMDGLAPIVHPTNPVRDLTMKQLKKIFIGEITNWKEVGGKDMPITVIIREEGSGARGAFEDIVHEDIDPAPTLILVGTGGVRAGVAGDPSAISYITPVAVDETVRALTVDGVEAIAANVLAGTFPIIRPALFLTKGEPSPLEQKFIDWVLGPEGQQMLEEMGLVRVR